MMTAQGKCFSNKRIIASFSGSSIPLTMLDSVSKIRGGDPEEAKLVIGSRLADLTTSISGDELNSLSPEYKKLVIRKIITNRFLRIKYCFGKLFTKVDILFAQLLVFLEGIKTRDYSGLKFWGKINWSKIRLPKIRLPKIKLNRRSSSKKSWNDYYLALWGKIPWPKIKPEKQLKTRKVVKEKKVKKTKGSGFLKGVENFLKRIKRLPPHILMAIVLIFLLLLPPACIFLFVWGIKQEIYLLVWLGALDLIIFSFLLSFYKKVKSKPTESRIFPIIISVIGEKYVTVALLMMWVIFFVYYLFGGNFNFKV